MLEDPQMKEWIKYLNNLFSPKVVSWQYNAVDNKVYKKWRNYNLIFF